MIALKSLVLSALAVQAEPAAAQTLACVSEEICTTLAGCFADTGRAVSIRAGGSDTSLTLDMSPETDPISLSVLKAAGAVGLAGAGVVGDTGAVVALSVFKDGTFLVTSHMPGTGAAPLALTIAGRCRPEEG